MLNTNTLRYKSALEYAILSVIGLFILSAPYNWLFSSYLIVGIGGLALVYGLCFDSFATFKNPKWQRYARCFAPMVGLYLLALIGMLYTPYPKAGAILEKDLSFIVFPAIFLLLGPDFFSFKRLKALGGVFYVSCLLIILIYMLYFAKALHHPALQAVTTEHGWFYSLNLFSTNPVYYIGNGPSPRFIVHHTFQVLYMLMAMSMVIYTWAVYPDWYKPWYKKTLNILLLSVFLVFGIFLSLSKMGYLAFGVWSLVMLFFLIYKRLYRVVAIGMVALAVGGCLLLYALTPGQKQLISTTYHSITANVFHKNTDGKTYREGSVYARLMFWQNAVDAIKEKPLFGWGTGAEHCVMNPTKFGWGHLQADPHPHNQWLLYGIRFGLIGFLGLAWLFFRGFRYAYQTRNGLLALLMFLTFCFSLTERNLDFKIGIIFFGLMYGLLVAFSQYTLKQPESKKNKALMAVSRP